MTKIRGWMAALALAAAATGTGCGDAVAPAAVAGGGGPGTSSFAPGPAAPDRAPFVRLSAYREAAEAIAAAAESAPADGAGVEDGAGAADGAGGAGGADGAGAAAAGGAGGDGAGEPGADGMDGAGTADLAADAAEGVPSDGESGWSLDVAGDRGVFVDARAGLSLVLPSRYWDKVGAISKKDSYSAKFKRLDNNLQTGISYRAYPAVDLADTAAADAYSESFRARMEEDARMLGGALEVEARGTGTCAGLPAITHAMTIRSDLAVRAASVFAHGRVYTLTVSGPKLLYLADLEKLLSAICASLKITGAGR